MPLALATIADGLIRRNKRSAGQGKNNTKLAISPTATRRLSQTSWRVVWTAARGGIYFSVILSTQQPRARTRTALQAGRSYYEDTAIFYIANFRSPSSVLSDPLAASALPRSLSACRHENISPRRAGRHFPLRRRRLHHHARDMKICGCGASNRRMQ